MKFLGLIPARRGSKGIVRKNMRPLGDAPMIAHTVRAALGTTALDRVIVSSDDREILGWARLHGCEVDVRPAALAGDQATIADVAADIVARLGWTDGVVVLQPTSPLRGSESISRAIDAFLEFGGDSLATVVREPHLYWFDASGDGADVRPLFADRRNRQFMRHGVLRETGAIQIVRANVLLSDTSMVGASHQVFELGGDEAFDIDTIDDYLAAQRRFHRGMVVFRLCASASVGSGHLFHCLRLAEELGDHEVHFLLKDCDPFVGAQLEQYGYAYTSETTNLLADVEILREGVSGRRVIVNDVLDTKAADVLAEKLAGYSVVNVEDLGPGAALADWVVNALYPVGSSPSNRSASGAPFVTLRGEFMDLPPKVIARDATKVLLTFGGTDPGNLTSRVGRLLHLHHPHLQIEAIIGPGAREPDLPDDIVVHRTVESMAAAMMGSDLVVTSAGRTVYEAAATGTPVIVLAQNAREATHAHLGFDTGVVFLGIAALTGDELIRDGVTRLLDDYSLRRELSTRLRGSVDMRGAERIASRIRSMLIGLE